MTYTTSDDCTWWNDCVLPIEEESPEAAYCHFSDKMDECKTKEEEFNKLRETLNGGVFESAEKYKEWLDARNAAYFNGKFEWNDHEFDYYQMLDNSSINFLTLDEWYGKIDK